MDLKKYKLPGDQLKITKLFGRLPVNTRSVNFDISDYEFLFKDEKTINLIKSGNTIGCFYIESPGMRSLLKRLEVDNFELLTAASSIIRPGVAESGMMQQFILRHKNPAMRKYFIPQMEKVLGDTYGIMIYQEDVLKVAHFIAGLTMDEADILRRAMSGKMRSHRAMEALTTRFFDSCREKKLSDFVAKELWRQIESFAGYAFCKAHSASFALLSFQVAYLKAHYPAEFMASVLSNGGGYYSAAVYIQEAKRLDIEVKLPCINNSGYQYSGKDKIIRIGLTAIKNISHETCKVIISEREQNGIYTSLLNFISRVQSGFEETSMLIKIGALDCFNETRPSLLRMLDIYSHHLRSLSQNLLSLFADEYYKLIAEVKTDKDYTPEVKCMIEYDSLGYMVTKHPLEFYSDLISKPGIIKAAEMYKFDGKRVKMAGWFMTSKRIRTKKGDIMKFLSLEDLSGTFEAVIFPKIYSSIAEKTLSMGPFILEGKVDAVNGGNIIVEKLDIIVNSGLKSTLQKDSSDYYYTPDDEGFIEDDIWISKQEKFRESIAI